MVTYEKRITNKVNNASVSGKIATEVLEEKVGASMKMFEAMSSLDFFKSLDNKSLSELFLSMLPTAVDKDSFLKLAETLKGSPLSTQAKNLNSTYCSTLSDYIKSQLPDGDFSLNEINTAYKAVYEERSQYLIGMVTQLYLRTLVITIITNILIFSINHREKSVDVKNIN